MGTLSDIYRGVATSIAHTVNTMGGWLALICMVAVVVWAARLEGRVRDGLKRVPAGSRSPDHP